MSQSSPVSQPSYRAFFAGKKITVMGLGILGRGVGDVEFLAVCGASLIVTDLKKPEELSSSLERLKKFPNIQFVLGEHRKEDFRGRDMIIKAAGVPLDSPYIAEALKNNVPVYMSTALFAKFSGAVLIGVTGTRGKSTTTQMIYDGLKAAGKTAHLGGNIKGKSTLAMLPEVKENDFVVLELDFWQLQGFRDLKLAPHIAVFTNFMPDHMNYYKNDMKAYFDDKAAIYENQTSGDHLIVGEDVEARIKGRPPKSKFIVAPSLPPDWKLSVPGKHNRLNASCAREVLRLLGIPTGRIRTALELFAGLEGRLNLVADIKGVKIYNDSNATTPNATEAALDSFPKGKTLLIAGGADKGLEIDTLAAKIKTNAREVVFLDGTGTKRLSGLLPGVAVFDNLQKAFDHVMRLAKPGDVLLLSPGFASFGMFKNEYDRGAQFESIVRSYQDKNK